VATQDLTRFDDHVVLVSHGGRGIGRRRLGPPAQIHSRATTRDVEIDGVTIRASSRLRPLWGAAKRDEREFESPDPFELDRHALRHLGFGVGPHFRPGASLARMQARAAFAGLLARAPEFTLVTADLSCSPWARAFSRVRIEV
jgi:cytochrome P450